MGSLVFILYQKILYYQRVEASKTDDIFDKPGTTFELRKYVNFPDAKMTLMITTKA